MQCPKCKSELVPQEVHTIFGVREDVHTIFGVREGEVDILAQGEMQVAFCCGTAVLYEKPKQVIITPPTEIILP